LAGENAFSVFDVSYLDQYPPVTVSTWGRLGSSPARRDELEYSNLSAVRYAAVFGAMADARCLCWLHGDTTWRGMGRMAQPSASALPCRVAGSMSRAVLYELVFLLHSRNVIQLPSTPRTSSQARWTLSPSQRLL